MHSGKKTNHPSGSPVACASVTLPQRPNTHQPTTNTQHPTPNTQHPTPNTQHPTPNTQQPTTNY
ncbi:MAG: hypothetical protein ACHBN1_17855 [Heteroscytonema crispum UTEX LB 1556]